MNSFLRWVDYYVDFGELDYRAMIFFHNYNSFINLIFGFMKLKTLVMVHYVSFLLPVALIPVISDHVYFYF